MKLDQRKKAEELAELPYSVEVMLDETTDGKPVYVASIPELEGCMGQGETIGQAVTDLREAQIDYIESLLQDGLSVPEPASLATVTSASGSVTLVLNYPDEATGVARRRRPARLYEAAWVKPAS